MEILQYDDAEKTRLPPSQLVIQPSNISVQQKTRLPENSYIYKQQNRIQPIYTVEIPQRVSQFQQPYPQHQLQQFARSQAYDHSQYIQNHVVEIKNFQQEPSRRIPETFQCKNCNKVVKSLVRYQFGAGSWILAIILAFLGLGVAGLLPCCIKQCQDAEHYCTNCGMEMGTIKFMQLK